MRADRFADVIFKPPDKGQSVVYGIETQIMDQGSEVHGEPELFDAVDRMRVIKGGVRHSPPLHS